MTPFAWGVVAGHALIALAFLTDRRAARRDPAAPWCGSARLGRLS